MPILYCARWVLPISVPPLVDGGIVVDGTRIVAVGARSDLLSRFPEVTVRELGDAAIVPGFINAHSHLELTAMRGFLEGQEADFFAWLKKLTVARIERMTPDDLQVSAMWGACEAARSGVTTVADASDSAMQSMLALREVGLRGIVYQESFGPDPKVAQEHFDKLRQKVVLLREAESELVKCGVSPHAPYTVSAPQLEMISRFAVDEKLPLMMHAAETEMEVAFLRNGEGPFAEGLRSRGIEWQVPQLSPIQYLKQVGVLTTQPLLAHCIQVDDSDLQTLHETGTRVAHCPKSNAKLGHGAAPYARMLRNKIAVGLGSDSVASNNTCDLLEEARFALLLARSAGGENCNLTSVDVLRTATVGGANALGMNAMIGELSAGLQADFASIALNGSHQVPLYNVEDTLVFSSSGRDVVLTVVAGKEVYRDGHLTTVDEEQLRARINEIGAKLQA
jgi:cytosine/adenosine deaminase-related metal-dependent hydrolase